MRKIAFVFAVLGILLSTTPAAAQVSIGGRAAYHNDFDLGVGAQVGFDVPELDPNVRAQGDFTYFFPSTDGLDYFEVNANLLYDIPVADQPFTPFLLGGLDIARASVDAGGFGDASSTDIGLNLGGGLSFATEGGLRPSVGAKVELSGGDGFVLFGSVVVGG